MDRRVQVKLTAKVCLYILDHAFTVGSTEKIGFTDEDRGIRAGLIKRLHGDQIVLRKPRTGIDQDDAKVTPRQICNRLLSAGNRERAKPGRIDKRDTFCQTVGR